MSLARRLKEIADDLEDLSYEADDCEAFGIDGEHAAIILNLLRVLPHIVDHLEGYGPITDRDLRILKTELVGLQQFARAYDIAEAPPRKEVAA